MMYRRLGDDVSTDLAPAPAGLFSSGFDLGGWGLAEWAIAAAVVYFAWKLSGDVKRGARAIRGARDARRRKQKRRAQLKAELART